MRELEKDIAWRCGERFRTLLTENIQVVMPGVPDFDLCWAYLSRFNNRLRAGDALHLALASNLAVERIFTLDNTMLEEGRQLGVPVDRGIL